MKHQFLIKSLLFIPALLLMHSTGALAAIQEYAPAAESQASFEAVGKPGIIKIKGQGAKVDGHLALENGDAKGTFKIALDQFNTGIGLRDKHMKEKYLDTGAFPQATLEIQHVDLPKDFAPGKDVSGAKFKGQLTLKGVTKPVEGTVKIAGASMTTEANFAFMLTDYPVGVPSYMGITVADAVNVQVTIPSFAKK